MEEEGHAGFLPSLTCPIAPGRDRGSDTLQTGTAQTNVLEPLNVATFFTTGPCYSTE